jgi:hypothetical protein
MFRGVQGTYFIRINIIYISKDKVCENVKGVLESTNRVSEKPNSVIVSTTVIWSKW